MQAVSLLISPAEIAERVDSVGIINGTTDASGNIVLDAQGVATRAQVSAMAERFCENVAQ